MDRPHAPLSGRGPRVGLALVPLGFLAVFFVWPVGTILARGLDSTNGFGTETLAAVLGDARFREIIWFTVVQAALSTLLTLAIGLPVAMVLGRYRFRGHGLLQAVVTAPFALPTIVVALAFTSLGIQRSLVAILLAHCFFNVAVVARVVGGAAERLDRGPADAARMLGAGRVATFRAVTWPALRGSVLAAASVVFLFCFTSFGVILVLGDAGTATIETEIYRQTAQLLDLQTAAALSIIQLVAVIGVLVAAGAFGRRVGAGQRAPHGRERLTTRRSRLLAAVAVLPTLVLVLVPTIELLRRAAANRAYGFRHLTDTPTGLATSPAQAVLTSIGIAIAATAIAATLGLLLATALTGLRRPSRLVRATEALVVIPLGVSAVTVGFGFLITFDAPPMNLRASWWIIPIAHALVALPFVLRATVPVLRTIDHRQREAATMLGASAPSVWRAVDAPVVARAAAVASAFAFAISLGEFGATLFIVRPTTTTVPVAIYRLLSQPGTTNRDLAMTLAALLMLLTGAVAYLSTVVGARHRSAR